MLQITISKRAALMVALAILLVIPAVAFGGSVFDDVDDTNTHIEGITFMKNHGVSVGCDADNNYCPSDFVTRAQMATFMYRLSGTDPATLASVNAYTLDAGEGKHYYGVDLAGPLTAWFSGFDPPIPITTGTPTALATIEFQSGIDGSVFVTGQSSFFTTTGVAWLVMWLQLDNATCDTGLPAISIYRAFQDLDGFSSVQREQVSVAGVIDTTAGLHSMTLCAHDQFPVGTANPTATSNSIVVEFSAKAFQTTTPLP